jgi:RNA polymerase sigma factor (sigma-70 family)
MNEHGIHELVLRAKAGDAEALGDLFCRSKDMLHAHAHNLLGANWEGWSSSDLVSDTWKKALPGLACFQGGSNDAETAKALASWLRTILRRTWLNLLRDEQPPGPMFPLETRRTDDSSTLGHEPADKGETPSANLKHEDTRRLIQAALVQLPELDRQIVLMSLWEKRSFAEIAAIVGRDDKTVRRYFHRSLRQLRPLLRDLQ